jgi:hypothetical protein
MRSRTRWPLPLRSRRRRSSTGMAWLGCSASGLALSTGCVATAARQRGAVQQNLRADTDPEIPKYDRNGTLASAANRRFDTSPTDSVAPRFVHPKTPAPQPCTPKSIELLSIAAQSEAPTAPPVVCIPRGSVPADLPTQGSSVVRQAVIDDIVWPNLRRHISDHGLRRRRLRFRTATFGGPPRHVKSLSPRPGQAVAQSIAESCPPCLAVS